MITAYKAQKDYIERWKHNSLQHFVDGDYDWAASLVEKAGAKRVLEIGCGVGHSTLALANRGIQALSIDTIPEAISETRKLLESYGISVGILGDESKPDMLLCQDDVIENYHKVADQTKWVDLILICNPGGKLETDLTEKEIDMLHWGQYSDEQMKEEPVPGLHKWAILIAAARLAKEGHKKLMIIDRGTPEEVDAVLNIIPISTGMRGMGKISRPIKSAPANGIKIGKEKTEQLIWEAGLFAPE